MTEINWKEIVENYKDDFLDDLIALLKIDSVRDDDAATDEFPVGPGPVEALDAFLKIGQRDGFETESFDNWAGHIEYGAGEELMGILGHVDVVPVGSGWETDPFDPVIKEGRIYARGSSDDKGPTMAAYYALKIIRDLDLPVSKRARVIIGTDEESGWGCMDHYLKVAETPDFGFSPDANFPIINGEKGNVSIQLNFKGENSGDTRLVSFDSGLRPNMVPQDAEAIVEIANPAEVKTKFEDFLATNPVNGEITVEDKQVKLQVIGQASHGAQPANGINAATYLAAFLNQLPFENDAKAFLHVTATYLHESTDGQKLGIAHTDELMGELTSNFGIFKFAEDDESFVNANMRFPQGTDGDKILAQFEETLKDEEVTVEIVGLSKEPHYVPKEDPLVETLLNVYHKQTGLDAHEMIIGGGTYGRLLERGVAFGAMFPDSIDTMHQANEFMAIDDLMRAMAIYAESIYELIK